MHLLFDLDGTLTDSRPGIISSIRHALATIGLPVPEPDDLLWCIGPPVLEGFKKLVGPDAPALFEPTVKIYQERYGSIGLFENSVYPGIEQTLIEMRDLGHTLHVATSKAEVFARPILEHFQLDGYFASINGCELDDTRANKTELIAHIIQQQNINVSEAIMIGDREHDITGAAKNGVPAIGVLWGYGSGAELVASGAIATIRVPHLLAGALGAIR